MCLESDGYNHGLLNKQNQSKLLYEDRRHRGGQDKEGDYRWVSDGTRRRLQKDRWTSLQAIYARQIRTITHTL
jgi:hypothetical protein